MISRKHETYTPIFSKNMKNFPSMLHVLCTFPVPKYTKYPLRLQSNIAYDIKYLYVQHKFTLHDSLTLRQGAFK